MRQKRWKVVQPFGCDNDALCATVLIAVIVFVVATTLHQRPRAVLGCALAFAIGSMLQLRTFFLSISVVAAARSCVAFSQVATAYGDEISTIAATDPATLLITAFFAQTDDAQAAKSPSFWKHDCLHEDSYVLA